MQFAPPRRRNAPSVIIISLIDVLIVVLIFLIVTTTVRQQPAVKLALPESKQQKTGSTENSMVIYIPKSGPIFLKKDPVTFDQLQGALTQAMEKNPETTVSISADTDAPFGQIIKVMDVAKAAHVRNMSAFTKGSGAK
jgi:biopolymer transport protein ExbD